MAPARRLLQLAALAGALLGLGACGEPEGEAFESEFFGVNAQLLQPFPASGRSSELPQHLDSIQATGVSFVRSNLDWRILQPKEPANPAEGFDFASTDEFVAALAERGLRWQPTSQGSPTPDWAADQAAVAAGCGSTTPPARPTDYANLMTGLVKRYGRDGSFWGQDPELPYLPVTHWEIWNEPNFARFWCPGPQPERYADLYLEAHRAIHAVDPDAQVVLGGLAPFVADEPAGEKPVRMPVSTFLERATAAEPSLADTVDIVGVHPYAQDPAGVLDILGWYRATLDANGFEGVPMSANEIGWVTSGSGVPFATEADRPALLADSLESVAMSDCGVVAFAAHTWITLEANPVDPEHWYGIADPTTGTPYPTAVAYGERIDSLTEEGSDGEPIACPE